MSDLGRLPHLLRKEADYIQKGYELDAAPDFMREAADKLEAMQAEIERLRQIISDGFKALANGSVAHPGCSLEFMELLPNEIRLHVADLNRERG